MLVKKAQKLPDYNEKYIDCLRIINYFREIINNMPKVSIIMPVYNVEKYICDSIDSVLAQTYKDYELIIVDDGSPDSSPKICDDYADKYDNIYVIHKKNGGLSSARNVGVENAKGKYILFVDSDDTIQSDLLEKIVPKAEETGADVTIFGIHTYVYRHGEMVSEKKEEHSSNIFDTKEDLEKNFVYLSLNGMWNQAYDKLYLKRVITYNNVKADSFYDRVCEDTAFLLDLFPYIEKICVADGCYYNYFIRDTQSVVAKFIPDRYEKYYGRFCKTRKLMESFDAENYNEGYLYELYCTFIIWAYEKMFHNDCTYSIFKRYRYMKNIFSIRKEDEKFCNKAAEFISQQEIYKSASGSTQKVLLNILKKRYLIAWLYHIFALYRRNLPCRS